jgi:hypothetical protein
MVPFQLRRSVRAFWRANPLVRLLAVNTAIGFGLSALFVVALASFDLGHMGRLLGGEMWPFAIVLWFFIGLTFASVQMGIAVMTLPRGGGGAGLRIKLRPMTGRVPAAVRVRD